MVAAGSAGGWRKGPAFIDPWIRPGGLDLYDPGLYLCIRRPNSISVSSFPSCRHRHAIDNVLGLRIPYYGTHSSSAVLQPTLAPRWLTPIHVQNGHRAIRSSQSTLFFPFPWCKVPRTMLTPWAHIELQLPSSTGLAHHPSMFPPCPIKEGPPLGNVPISLPNRLTWHSKPSWCLFRSSGAARGLDRNGLRKISGSNPPTHG